MPTDPNTINQTAASIDNLGNVVATSSANRSTRKWNEKMYGLQRADSLADWNMQNEYNSPTSQMARLRAAGLNPHLVYGNGAVAGGTSATPRASSVGSYTERPITSGMTPITMGYVDMQLKEAQIDNLKYSNTVKEQDAFLRSAQTLKTLSETDGTKISNEQKKFNLDLSNELRSTSVDAAKANLQKTLANTKFTLDENERQAAMQAPNLLMAAEKVLNMRLDRVQTSWQINEIKQRIENLKKDASLKQLDIDLKEKGVQPGDALWQRIIARLIDGDKSVLKNAGSNIADRVAPLNRYTSKKPWEFWK